MPVQTRSMIRALTSTTKKTCGHQGCELWQMDKCCMCSDKRCTKDKKLQMTYIDSHLKKFNGKVVVCSGYTSVKTKNFWRGYCCSCQERCKSML